MYLDFTWEQRMLLKIKVPVLSVNIRALETVPKNVGRRLDEIEKRRMSRVSRSNLESFETY